MAEVYKAQDQVSAARWQLRSCCRNMQQTPNSPPASNRKQQQTAEPLHRQRIRLGPGWRYVFIVMEYVRGNRPEDRCSATWLPSTNARWLKLAAGVCQALVAHGQDIMHRDIKPQNIMVQPDGNCEGHGLRHRARQKQRESQDLQRARYRPLYLSRAGSGQRARRRKRHVLPRLRALRSRNRAAPL